MHLENLTRGRVMFPSPSIGLSENEISVFYRSSPNPGDRAVAGHTFHVQKTVEVRQGDTAVHRVPPVAKFIVRVKPRVKVLFTVFKLDKKETANGEQENQSTSEEHALLDTETIKTDKEATHPFMTMEWSQKIQNYKAPASKEKWCVAQIHKNARHT